MMKAFLSACLLLALLSPVASLRCYSCHSNKISCEKKTNTSCDTEETCISGVLYNNIGFRRLQTGRKYYKTATFQGCVKSENCHSGDYSLSSANGKFLQLKVSCCGTDVCNEEPVQLPSRDDLSPNGRQCPACLRFDPFGNLKKCRNQQTVSCLANETKCIDYSSLLSYANVYYETFKFQGCVTEDWCNLDGGSLLFGDLHLGIIKAKCSDAEKSSKQIILED